MCSCHHEGINRIRLEFKAYLIVDDKKTEEVLIESDWNLKHTARASWPDVPHVLIESDWNLKII